MKKVGVLSQIGDLTSDCFLECRQALCLVASRLPDKNISPEEVVIEALGFVTEGCSCQKEVDKIIVLFVRAQPRCYGVKRRGVYWRVLKSFFGEEQALCLYLKRFPRRLTDRQRQSVFCYLTKKIGFDAELVKQSLFRFQRRENRRRVSDLVW